MKLQVTWKLIRTESREGRNWRVMVFDFENMTLEARTESVSLVFIGKVDDLANPCLDDDLGAFVAGKKGHVEAAISQIER